MQNFSTWRHLDEALTARALSVAGVYEVVFGGVGNTKSWIRNSTYGVNEVQADTPDILSAAEYRAFWVRWANGLIEVGALWVKGRRGGVNGGWAVEDLSRGVVENERALCERLCVCVRSCAHHARHVTVAGREWPPGGRGPHHGVAGRRRQADRRTRRLDLL